ncbi:hypothetical protein CHCC15337_1625 [Bacillus paralicheniformis]|nr:hypothetical protein CHCC5022_2657 [Bacillus paralicheniformis]TWJ64934.1 hypothetical protein CHCC5021_1017 [Bacillus paralicheniformis]TWJ80754.1 hypothetical protein CHCC4186_4150 [Bacillus paralicheniformis]TWK27012.1 hypothetical protein CHCC20372_2056 [Bacillus paralicheniformis]TWK80201.1 hypothetical protein CHCC20333_0753 [Bacillus paralicheniformis]
MTASLSAFEKSLYDRSYKPLHLHEMDNKTVVYLLKKRNIRSFTY